MDHNCNVKGGYIMGYDKKYMSFYVHNGDWYEKIFIKYCPFCGVLLKNQD